MTKELNLRLHLVNEMNVVHVKFVLTDKGVEQHSLKQIDNNLKK